MTRTPPRTTPWPKREVEPARRIPRAGILLHVLAYHDKKVRISIWLVLSANEQQRHGDKVTPSLQAPDSVAGQVLPPPTRFAFWPMLAPDPNTGNFKFEVAATDISGNTNASKLPLVVDAYNAAAEDPRRTGAYGRGERLLRADRSREGTGPEAAHHVADV